MVRWKAEEEFMSKHDSVAVFSGGLDSTTLVYDMIEEGYTPHLVSFDYGQRHKKELQYASYTARMLELQHDIVDLTGITELISNSALTSAPQGNMAGRDFNIDGEPWSDTIEVPEGSYDEDSMKATVVPNRNMIMLSIACGIAVNFKYRTIGIGVHAGDHAIYPDCRPNFIFSVGQAMLDGNYGFHNFHNGTLEEHKEEFDATPQGKALYEEAVRKGYRSLAKPIYHPFLEKTKADIAYRALELNVPIHLTWSCYKGGDKHCGRCGTCVERLEAIDAAIKRWDGGDRPVYSEPVQDQTEYEDVEFWKVAISK